MASPFVVLRRRTVRGWQGSALLVGILAMGLTISAAFFTVIDGVLLKPLPVEDPAHLFVVGVPARDNPGRPSYVRRQDYRELSQLRGVKGVAGYVQGPGFFAPAFAEDEGLVQVKVTDRFFQLLGVRPRLGRPLLASDVVQADLRSVVIGDGLWRRRFGADERIVGRVETLGGRRVVVVGIMPPGFDFPLGANIWVPETPTAWMDSATFETLVRLDATHVLLQLVNHSLVTVSLDDYLRPREWVTSALLFFAAAVMLVVAWVHLAAFQMGRAFDRGRELALQRALGATSWRLLEPWLWEAVVLNAAAGSLAWAFLPSTTAAVVRLMPPELTVGRAVGPDARVLVFGLVMSAVCSAVLTLGPMFVVRDTHLANALRGRSSEVGNLSFARLRGLSMTGQVALVALLLYAAGSAVHSYVRVRQIDVGMDLDRLIWIELPRRAAGAANPFDVQEACRSLEQLPWVASATPGVAPFAEYFTIMQVGSNQGASTTDAAQSAVILPGHRAYFATLGIRVIEGSALDRPAPSGGVLLSLALSRALGLSRPVVGQTVLVGGGARTVVGLVADVHLRPGLPAPLLLYDAAVQAQGAVIVRTTTAHGDELPQVLTRLRSSTGQTAPMRVRRGADFYDRVLSGHRARLLLLSFCGFASLLLGAVSVYAAAAEVARQRLKDSAIRLALGGRPEHVIRAVVSPILTCAMGGLALGVVGGVAAAKLGASVFYGMSAVDPPSLAAVSAIVIGCTSAAALRPMRRLTRVNVFAVLKDE